MRKSLKEQIESKCIHFNGVQNKICKAGINYKDVRVDSAPQFGDLPCFKEGCGDCDKSEFPSPAMVQKQVDEINKETEKILLAFKLKPEIKKEHGNKYGTGIKECPECGGNLHYAYFGNTNGHLHMKCENDNCIGFME